jgi:pyridoxamine 5'-phosphate oxidase-like protein
MPIHEPIETTNLDKIYGAPPVPWSFPLERLEGGALKSAASVFLGTVRPDGRPHAAGIGAAWYDGDVYFQTGPGTQKARNVAANPACTIAASLPGIDIVFEGDAERVTDASALEAVAAIYRDGGWPVQVEDDGLVAPYSAPSGGPPPWHVYRVSVHTVFGVGGDPAGATRWRF